MSADAIWQAFAETGDPLYYMLYKSAEKPESGGKEKADGRRRENTAEA